ncbi:hypothetical protein RIF29_38541 [Crotalaria pallida]|uniref:Uncharacterized protein n=1 Tax=Crotalaria pallida TaxID=3830 RepID=A0AAN9E4X1_CROPI
MAKNTTLVDNDDDDGGEVQYSLALEYNGLPPVYDLPQAAPISVDNIPVAPEQVLFSDVFAGCATALNGQRRSITGARDSPTSSKLMPLNK